MEKKKSVREKVEDILALFRGQWGRYPDDEDEDTEPEENDPRYRKKWEIGISDGDAKSE